MKLASTKTHAAPTPACRIGHANGAECRKHESCLPRSAEEGEYTCAMFRSPPSQCGGGLGWGQKWI